MSVYYFLRQLNITSLAKQNPEYEWIKRRAGQQSSFLSNIAKYGGRSFRVQQESFNKIREALSVCSKVNKNNVYLT